MKDRISHWISLYLSGQYPGFYRLPNRFEVLLKIRQLDSTNFEESITSLIKDKGDVEFYNSLLTAFETYHGSKAFWDLLIKLEVPEEVMQNPDKTGKTVTEKPVKAHEALQLNKHLHKDLIPFFSEWIKSGKLYRWAYIQAFNVLNSKLENYCNQKLWKGRRTEMDAINTIFDECASENTFEMARGTDTEKWMEAGLKWLFEWAVKYYRNPAAHQIDYLNSEEEFIESMFLLSMLMKRIDDSKISK